MGNTAFLLVLISALSKIIGFAREMVVSYFYGTSSLKDAYVIASTIPNLLSGFVATAMTVGFIPIYNRVRKNRGEEEAVGFTSNVGNLSFLVITVFVAFVLTFTEPVVRLFASGFEGETLSTAVFFTRIMIFSVYSLSLFNLYQGYLNANKSFIVSAFAPFFANVTVILFIILSGVIDYRLLPFGFMVGYLLQFIGIFPELRKTGYSHSFKIDIHDRQVRDLVFFATPMIISLLFQDIGNIIDKNIASLVVVGGISALEYAIRLTGMFSGILIVPISTSVYPSMSNAALDKNYSALKKITRDTAVSMATFLLPCIVGLIILAEPVISFVFGRGEFGDESIIMTAGVLACYAPMLIGQAFTDIYSRAFYSLENTKTPVVISIIAIGIDIILKFVLSHFFGLNGLAIATATGRVISGILMIMALRFVLGKIGAREFISKLSRIGISSILMGIAVYFVYQFAGSRMPLFISLLITLLAAFAVYFPLVIFLKVLRLEDIQNLIFRKKRKQKKR